MAKQQTTPPEVAAQPTVDVDITISRAWDLFARNVNVAGQPTMNHEKLAENCWVAAEAFESFMNPKPKG